MTILVKNRKVFCSSGKLCLWNHAEMKLEANTMGVYPNAVVLHKKENKCQRKKWPALSKWNNIIFFVLLTEQPQWKAEIAFLMFGDIC